MYQRQRSELEESPPIALAKIPRYGAFERTYGGLLRSLLGRSKPGVTRHRNKSRILKNDLRKENSSSQAKIPKHRIQQH